MDVRSTWVRLSLSSTLFVLLSLGTQTAQAAPVCREMHPPAPHKHWPAPVAFMDDLLIGGSLTPAETYASKVYLRLTGNLPNLTSPRFRKVVRLIEQKQYMQATRLTTDDPNFLDVRLRNFAAPFTNREFATTEPMNDLQALIIGVVRDELDARLILTGDISYRARASLGLPAPSRDNNDHYLAFERGTYTFQNDMEYVGDQWADWTEAAGAFTTRAWAAAQYTDIMGKEGGTNRRSVKYALDAFLCAPIESWKMRGLPDYFVRRDVDRAPAGDTYTYQNHCRNCHGAMDGMGGAFAKYDFVGGKLTYFPAGVAAKMNQNGHFYPHGYVTTDDSWMILFKQNLRGGDFGWRGSVSGKGVKAFAETLANSTAFSDCMVSRVFAEICGKSIREEKYAALAMSLRKEFEGQNYNLKALFARTASLPECIVQE